MKYIDKTTGVVIYACQWTGTNENKIMIKQFGMGRDGKPHIKIDCMNRCNVKCSNGTNFAIKKLDYVLQIDGKFSIMKKTEFERTFKKWGV